MLLKGGFSGGGDRARFLLMYAHAHGYELIQMRKFARGAFISEFFGGLVWLEDVDLKQVVVAGGMCALLISEGGEK